DGAEEMRALGALFRHPVRLLPLPGRAGAIVGARRAVLGDGRARRVVRAVLPARSDRHDPGRSLRGAGDAEPELPDHRAAGRWAEDSARIAKRWTEMTYVTADRSEKSLVGLLSLESGSAIAGGGGLVLVFLVSLLARAGLLKGGWVVPS